MTDENKTGDKDTAKSGKLKKGLDVVTGVNDLPEGKAKRTIYYITGISDIYFIIASVKQTFSLLFQRASFVKKQIKNLDGPPVDSDANQPFAEVMKRSNRPVSELLDKASLYKKYWLCCFFALVLILLFLTSGYARLLLNGSPNMSLLRATLTCGVLFAAGIFTFIKALTCEFMGWQLRNKAHSDAEQGTLRYFLNDGGVRNTFNFSQAGQERGPHE
ncbi:TraX-like protein [Salmonella enterica]|nr:TraX-like protein [Salmonella enterica]EIS4525380.1 TraX-like protein [Salmonella enterica]